jgi:hypothetical protein
VPQANLQPSLPCDAWKQDWGPRACSRGRVPHAWSTTWRGTKGWPVLRHLPTPVSRAPVPVPPALFSTTALTALPVGPPVCSATGPALVGRLLPAATVPRPVPRIPRRHRAAAVAVAQAAPCMPPGQGARPRAGHRALHERGGGKGGAEAQLGQGRLLVPAVNQKHGDGQGRRRGLGSSQGLAGPSGSGWEG